MYSNVSSAALISFGKNSSIRNMFDLTVSNPIFYFHIKIRVQTSLRLVSLSRIFTVCEERKKNKVDRGSPYIMADNPLRDYKCLQKCHGNPSSVVITQPR